MRPPRLGEKRFHGYTDILAHFTTRTNSKFMKVPVGQRESINPRLAARRAHLGGTYKRRSTRVSTRIKLSSWFRYEGSGNPQNHLQSQPQP